MLRNLWHRIFDWQYRGADCWRGIVFLGFRWPFLIYGVGVALAALVVWIMMPRVKEGTEKDSSVKPPMKLREAWGDTAFRAALTSNFAHGWANMGVRVS